MFAESGGSPVLCSVELSLFVLLPDAPSLLKEEAVPEVVESGVSVSSLSCLCIVLLYAE